MSELLLATGILASIFVGFNIGGSSTGITWGPPVGAGIVTKTTAAGIMGVFVFVGGWTVGRNVMTTLSQDVITVELSLSAGVAVLFFIGLGILLANIFGVPVPTSMTTVGAIAGLGLATDSLNYVTIAEILSWWIVTPVLSFWLGAVIGRYIYPGLSERVRIEKSTGPLVEYSRAGLVPRPKFGPNTTYSEFVSTAVVIVIGCYMAFSAGASNVPNAAAPIVGGDAGLASDTAIVLATVAISLGGFTIARRTMESVGGELSDIPLLAALIVMLISASITTTLSYIGIPISLVMSTVMTIVGIGWGRATRPITVRDTVLGEAGEQDIAMGALTVTEEKRLPTRPIGAEEPPEILRAGELFNPRAVMKYLSLWILGPSVSTGLAYGFFRLVPGIT